MTDSKLLNVDEVAEVIGVSRSYAYRVIRKLNEELGLTILLSEQRLEEAVPLADHLIVLEQGRLLAAGAPQETAAAVRGHAIFSAMPTAARIAAALGAPENLPLTVREGQAYLRGYAQHPLPEAKSAPAQAQPVLRVRDGWFRYAQGRPDVLRGFSLTLRPGELYALTGSNGSGKTTALGVLAGQLRLYRGSVYLDGKKQRALRPLRDGIAAVPQDPRTLFAADTVCADLASLGRDAALLDAVVQQMALAPLLERHPFDLSGGEQQRAALAKVLLMQPRVLLLDEPTKGLDAEFKRTFARIIRRLTTRGVCVIMVSHDAEFCASFADRCAMFFDGAIVAEGTPREFFSSGSFYTTSASRMARGLLPGAITPEDVITACGGVLPPEPELPDEALQEMQAKWESEAEAKTYLLPSEVPPLPLWRKLTGGLGILGAVVCLVRILRISDLSELLTEGGLTSLAGDTFKLYLAMLVSLFVVAVSFSRAAPQPVHSRLGGRPLSKRTRLASAVSLLLVPLTIFVGIVYFGKKSYGAVSILVLLECMAPFALIFEGRKPKARELVLIAALCALAVAGRAALFMLPGFKPVAALVILSGVAFGGETGFLVGAMSMLTSNVLFGQGPWTPFQMFAMGLIGFLAGVCFQKGLLRAGRAPLAIFGAVSVVLIYGGLMNPASAILYQPNLSWSVLKAYYLTGFPFDLVHAAATALFLWFGAEPMLEKLERVKRKYGLTEIP